MPEPSSSTAAVAEVPVAGDAPVVETPLVADTSAAPAEKIKVRKRGRVTFWLAITWLGLVVFHALFADVLPWVKDYQKQDILASRSAPTWLFWDNTSDKMGWMGTDRQGRDIFSRAVYGGRVSLLIGATSITLGLFFGGVFGLIAGYYRKKADTVITTVMDVVLAFPPLILALLLVTFGANSDGSDRQVTLFGQTFTLSRTFLVVFALSILSIPPLTRLVRANTLVYSQREFVMAARALGAGDRRVIVREIFPNVVPPMLSFSLTGMAILIVAEGALAFLGLSVRPPTPTWGFMIVEGQQVLRDAWWVSLMPAFVMFLTVLSINLLGDVLQNRFNVKEAVG